MPPKNDRRCSVEYCERRHVSKGYCGGHYQQHRLGKPITPMVKSLPVNERFMAKVRMIGQCWEWAATRTADGYGSFGLGGKVVNAHRASWIIFRGPIPPGRQIDHTCHNRACVNPDHLQVVTRKENMENRAGAHRNSRSGVRGVFPSKNRWVAVVNAEGKRHHIGRFDTIPEAEAAVIAKRNELFTNNLLDRKAS